MTASAIPGTMPALERQAEKPPVSNTIELIPVGTVRSDRTEPVDDSWDSVRCTIQLDASRFKAEALSGLDSFSHVEVLYWFHQVRDEKIVSGARHPRGRTDWPLVGIFAQRGKNRPNRLGATVCEIVSVDGLTLEVKGLDAIDGTPVLDLKPVMHGFLPRTPVTEPAWVGEVMADYW